MDAFSQGARFYEAFSNAEGRLDREGPFLRARLAEAPANSVLDLACGTGLHAHYLAELEAEVTAWDVSEAMIGHARRVRPHPRVTYQVGDMQDVDGGPWGLVLCLGNSLALLASPDALEQTFRQVHANLLPGGLFAIQVVNYVNPTMQQPRHRIEERCIEEADVVAIKNLVPKGDRTYLAINYFADTGDEVLSIGESAVLNHWSETALRETAERQGFSVQAVQGDYEGAPYDPGASPDIILTLKAPIP